MPRFEVDIEGTVYIDAEDAEQAEFYATEDLQTGLSVFRVKEVIELNG